MSYGVSSSKTLTHYQTTEVNTKYICLLPNPKFTWQITNIATNDSLSKNKIMANKTNKQNNSFRQPYLMSRDLHHSFIHVQMKSLAMYIGILYSLGCPLNIPQKCLNNCFVNTVYLKNKKMVWWNLLTKFTMVCHTNVSSFRKNSK